MKTLSLFHYPKSQDQVFNQIYEFTVDRFMTYGGHSVAKIETALVVP